MKTIRIGMVNYINTAPIHEMWKRRNHPQAWELVEAQPSELNKKLAAAEIDLGFVSSIEYGKCPDDYVVLDDLSISASGPVGSVFLFSKCGIQDLADQKILLSSQSETSAALVRIILENFYKLQPSYVTGDVLGEGSDQYGAVMAIGDDALRLIASGEYPIHLDLGDVWFKHTGLPFVFSVFAVRKSFIEKNERELRQIHKEFLACKQEGVTHFDQVCRAVAPRIPMDCRDCHDYLLGIEYDLSEKKIQSLQRFFAYLLKKDMVRKSSLELKIFK